ncbi:SNF2 family N-terminal domain-containing protein [Trichoderma compactum]
MQVEDIRVQLLVTPGEWNDKSKKLGELSPKSKIIVRMKVDVLIFGPQKSNQLQIITEELASSEYYLQEPHYDTIQCSYKNPQSLHIPGLQASSLVQAENFSSEVLALQDTGELDEQSSQDQEAKKAALSSLIFDIDSFFNDLPKHVYLSYVPIDNRIQTVLLDHQRVAVDFISRRENKTGRSMWQSHTLEDGNTVFQHTITGAKSREASDCLGGIIADAMGLGKTLTILAAIVHSIDAASAFALHGAKGRAKATIVIVPSELLLNTWSREIDKHISFGAVRSIQYHGPERSTHDATLSNYDIILTTYGTLMVEFRKRTGPLYRLSWYRLVLDEAHTIRNSSSKQFEAVVAISANIRWCLTGTPIQNSLDDLGSLVKFLRVPLFEDGATFRKHVSKVHLQRDSTKGEFKNLLLLLGSICLRRNRGILPSPGYTIEDQRLDFTAQEREQYTFLEMAFKRSMTLAAKNHCGGSPHQGVMEALLRLRMFCNNGLDTSSSTGLLNLSGEVICSYCSCDVLSISRLMDSADGYLTRCLRLLCSECKVQYQSQFQGGGSLTCNLCQKNHGVGDFSTEASPDTVRILERPTKIQALVRDVVVNYFGHKCIIFSFWKKTLDVVGKALDHQGVKYLRIDGDTTPRKRNNILTEFQSRSASRIIMMTFSTGAVGLNGLTVADRVHILEPQWNPAVEDQAIGRALRIDQTKQVVVVRYAMRQSIEEAVQSRQFRKLQLAGGGFHDESKRSGSRANPIEELGAYLQHGGNQQ